MIKRQTKLLPMAVICRETIRLLLAEKSPRPIAYVEVAVGYHDLTQSLERFSDRCLAPAVTRLSRHPRLTKPRGWENADSFWDQFKDIKITMFHRYSMINDQCEMLFEMRCDKAADLAGEIAEREAMYGLEQVE